MFYNFLEDDNQFLKAFDAISESNFYKGTTPELGYQHKIGHIQKVMLFSKIIAQNESLDEQQTKILLASAAFHDSGRIKDRIMENMEKLVQKLQENILKIIIIIHMALHKMR